jgi:hypothetical protein
MTVWRPAHCISTLIGQANVLFPTRTKATDGTVGDASHQGRESDHNPWIIGPDGIRIVSALDLTTDHADGANTEGIAEILRVHRDPRLKYMIYEGRMFSSYPTRLYRAWSWRPYYGENPHRKHFHLSVQPKEELYDDKTPWNLTGLEGVIKAIEIAQPILRLGSEGPAVKRLQTLLTEAGYDVGWIDSDFGPKTEAAVKAFQFFWHLDKDGVVGPATWGRLLQE